MNCQMSVLVPSSVKCGPEWTKYQTQADCLPVGYETWGRKGGKGPDPLSKINHTD